MAIFYQVSVNGLTLTTGDALEADIHELGLRGSLQEQCKPLHARVAQLFREALVAAYLRLIRMD